MIFIFLQTSKLKEQFRFYFLVILLFFFFVYRHAFHMEIIAKKNTTEIVLFDNILMSFMHLKSVRGVSFFIKIKCYIF